MSGREIVIIGAGGFGRGVLVVVAAINEAGDEPVWEFRGFIDDGEPDTEALSRIRARHLGGSEELTGLSGCWYVVGIGDPEVRRRLAAAADSAGLRAAVLVHPSATLGLDVELGAGSVVCSHVSITTNVRIGSHVHLNLNSTVGHDCRLDSYVTINPGSTISGKVHLAEDVTVGTNSAITQGLSLGAASVVGAGAVVVRDVPAGTTVVGVPARPLKR